MLKLGTELLKGNLDNPRNNDGRDLGEEQQEPRKLENLLKRALGGRDEQKPEEVIDMLKSKIIDELKQDQSLKSEAKNELKAKLIEEMRADLKSDQILISQMKTSLKNEIKQQRVESFDQLEADLKDKTFKVEKLDKALTARNAEVQQLQEKNKEKALKHTVGVGLTIGLVAFIVLERTVRLDVWTVAGIAVLASVLAVGGATYLALKPSNQVNKAEIREVNSNDAAAAKQVEA